MSGPHQEKNFVDLVNCMGQRTGPLAIRILQGTLLPCLLNLMLLVFAQQLGTHLLKLLAAALEAESAGAPLES